MDAKKLYKKHLKGRIGKKYLSPKQLELIRYEAAISAIEEALSYQDNKMG